MYKLDRVTITGADDGVEPGALISLSKEFPFVEWGVLASASKTGDPRYPSLAWQGWFREAFIAAKVRPSLHLCGGWVRHLLVGDIDPMVFQLINGFARVQLNFRADRTACKPEQAMAALATLRDASVFHEDLQFLFQLDAQDGNQHLEDICLAYVNEYGEPSNMFGLFDASGGQGIFPRTWPNPIYKADEVFDYHGYAGGLGPDNLEQELPRIAEAAQGTRFWIDMESGVRTNDAFDLTKVRRCLEIAVPFVSQER